jgi:hypothetical protein
MESETGTGKERALEALRTWRTYMDDRDPLIRAARAANATIAEIVEASRLAKGTVRSVLEATDTDTTQEDPMTATAADVLARWHHPHFVAAEPDTRGYYTKYSFRPFTGAEPKPEMPSAAWDDENLTWEDKKRLSEEYRAMEVVWGQARFKLQARPVVTKAVPVWQEYARARKAMDAVFAEFWEIEDGKWKAQTLKLADAQREALAAASEWDGVAKGLAEFQEEHVRAVGEEDALLLRQVTPDFGIDTSDWEISWLGDYEASYRRETPLVRDLTKVIEGQKAKLREAAALLGDD